MENTVGSNPTPAPKSKSNVMNIKKNDYANPSGTSFHGNIVLETPRNLRAIFGEPTYDQNDGSDKTNLEWFFELADGSPITIYDWKYYRPIGDDEVIEWHVGAHTSEIASVAEEAIRSVLFAHEG